ncbi:MAG: hypothetical protein EOP43_05910 [Sphingobacteriaceae bacterium]|nr:MAG: hypothetical protein EOP43_05910 [Sphingobacteriaceae bacterium]
MVSIFTRILIGLGFFGLLTLEAILLQPKPQKGFIINLKGDTVSCMLKNIGSSEVKFKKSTDSIYHLLSIMEAKEYNIPKKHLVYRALIVPKGITPLFLPRLDSGEINLYAFYERIGKSTHTHLYAVKAAQQIRKIYGYNPDDDNKQQLLQLIGDNPQAVSYLNTDRSYSEKTVTNAVKIYNGEDVKLKK